MNLAITELGSIDDAAILVGVFRGEKNVVPGDRANKETMAAPTFVIDGFGRRRSVERLRRAGNRFGQGAGKISEVIQMGKENVAADTIVNKMRESKAVYRLNATGLVRLHDQGVPDPVLNYMQQTYLDAVRREQVQADWNTWEMWRDHFW